MSPWKVESFRRTAWNFGVPFGLVVIPAVLMAVKFGSALLAFLHLTGSICGVGLGRASERSDFKFTAGFGALGALSLAGVFGWRAGCLYLAAWVAGIAVGLLTADPRSA